MTRLKILVFIGRLLFVFFLLLQCVLFNLFFVEYSQPAFSFMAFLYIPGLVAWIVFVVLEGSIHWLWFVLGSHIWIALVPYLGVMLSEVVDSIDERGHSSLTLTICISPILALLMLNTGPPREKHRELLKKLSTTVSLEMIDAIELLEMAMNFKETSQVIPVYFKSTIGVLVCISLLITPLELMEVSVQDTGKVQTLKAPLIVRFFLQVMVLNSAFLAIRLVLLLDFGQEASIFLVKNAVKITTSCFEVCGVFKLCGCNEEDEDEELIIAATS